MHSIKPPKLPRTPRNIPRRFLPPPLVTRHPLTLPRASVRVCWHSPAPWSSGESAEINIGDAAAAAVGLGSLARGEGRGTVRFSRNARQREKLCAPALGFDFLNVRGGGGGGFGWIYEG